MASADPRRGDIWLVAMGAGRKGEPGKNRPAVVVSADELLVGVEYELVVVVPLSTSRQPGPLRPVVSPDDGIDQPSAAVCRAVRAVARSRLLRPIGQVSPEALADIEQSLATVLGLDDSRLPA
jgi:mRNA interferase MazF